MEAAIKPLHRKWRVCGPAFTVRPEYPEDMLITYAAIQHVKPGDVLVIDAAGATDIACFGASMAGAAKQNGAVGVVIDGMCLTSELLTEREGLPIFCRGTVARSAGRDRPGWMNGLVGCGGVLVNPGDIVLGDADGVVVLPSDRALEIIEKSETTGARSALGRANPTPYRERSTAGATLRKLPGVVWE